MRCPRKWGNFIVAYADAPNQAPREVSLKQKFALLGFLALTPHPGLNGIPIDFVQPRQIRSVFKVVRPRIGQRKCPTAVIGIRPGYGFVKIGLKVNDRILSALVSQFAATHMHHVQHYGARAEVKRNALSDKQGGMTDQAQRSQPALLDVAHANHCPW